MLSPEIQSEILALHYGQGKSLRSIERELGVCRKSIRRVVARRSVEFSPVTGPRSSILDSFKPLGKEVLRRDPYVTSTGLFHRLRKDGYMGGKTVVKDWLRSERAPKAPREAFLRLDFQPGECAQVDWGEFGDVFHDGVKIHAFIMVLAYSRLLYVEFTRSERFEEFVRCHENAFRYFGGVPRECWYDNLATAVTDRMGKIVRFNSRFFAYMGHHSIRPHACNPARGNEKGRVEGGVKLIRNSFWSGRIFKNFADLQAQAVEWMNSACNEREHRTTRKIPRLHFEAEEKPALLPMNVHPFDTDEVISRVVPPDFHVLFETNRYSVPWTLVGMTVTMRINGEKIRVFYNERQVCSHDRLYRKHQVVTIEPHRAGLLERKGGGERARDGWQLAAAKNIGPEIEKYIGLLRSGQRSLRHEIARLLALSTIYGEAAVHDAVREMLASSIVGVNNLEIFLRNTRGEGQRAPEPIAFANQKLNRIVPTPDLRRFDALLFREDEKAGASDKDKDNGNDD